jgi:hypothetical protein
MVPRAFFTPVRTKVLDDGSTVVLHGRSHDGSPQRFQKGFSTPVLHAGSIAALSRDVDERRCRAAVAATIRVEVADR